MQRIDSGTRIRHQIRQWCLLCLFLLLVPAQVWPQENTDSLVVIAAPEQTPNAISKNTLRVIFGMRLRNWPDDGPVRVFVLNDAQPTHAAFAKQILNIYPHQLRQAWDRLVFSGTGQAPTEVGSEKEMLEKVATTPGAIGYLQRSKVNDSVRILQIQ